VVPKTEIPGIGWFGVFTDPTGNKVGLYTAQSPQ
jgi:predicted enzyme related to lactoylglutathione lyase